MPRDGWRGEPSLCVKSGTSMAAPWVSGTVALMMAAAGRPLTIHEIRRALIGTVDPHPGPAGMTSTQLGYGYLNTAAAVAAARQLGNSPTGARPAAREDQEQAEAYGWAPVWVEDAAAGAFADDDETLEASDEDQPVEQEALESGEPQEPDAEVEHASESSDEASDELEPVQQEHQIEAAEDDYDEAIEDEQDEEDEEGVQLGSVTRVRLPPLSRPSRPAAVRQLASRCLRILL